MAAARAFVKLVRHVADRDERSERMPAGAVDQASSRAQGSGVLTRPSRARSTTGLRLSAWSSGSASAV